MICGSYPMLIGLLNATSILLNITHTGTHTKNGNQAAYYNEECSGNLDVHLTNLRSTFNNTNGSSDSTVLHHVYRLKLKIPDELEIDFEWENLTLSGAIKPLNISSDALDNSVSSRNIFSSLTSKEWFVDFILENSSIIQESLKIGVPYKWRYTYPLPGLYSPKFEATLTPFGWRYLNMTDISILKNFSLQHNFSTDIQRFYDGSLNISLYNLSISDPTTLSGNCTIVDYNYQKLLQWAYVTNCSVCVFPDSKFATYNSSINEVVQAGAYLSLTITNDNFGTHSQAGDEINFAVVIQHSGSEDARDVEITISAPEYGQISLNDGYSYTSYSLTAEPNELMLKYSAIPLHSSDVTLNASIRLQNSVPLQQYFSFGIKCTWLQNSTIYGGDKYMLSSRKIPLKTADVAIDAQYCYLYVPSVWSEGSAASANALLFIPKGTIRSITLSLVFQTEDGYPFIELMQPTIDTLVNYTVVKREKREQQAYELHLSPVINHLLSKSNLHLQVRFYPLRAYKNLQPITVNMALHINGEPNLYVSRSSTITKPDLSIRKVIRFVSSDDQKILVQIYVNHTSFSTSDAFDINILDEFDGFEISQESLSRFSVTADGRLVVFSAQIYQLTKGSLNFSYEAIATANSDFPNGRNNNTVTLFYRSSNDSTAIAYKVFDVSCTIRQDNHTTSVKYNHGYTALGVIVGLICGLIIPPIILLIMMAIMKKTGHKLPLPIAQPSATDYSSVANQKHVPDLLLDLDQKVNLDTLDLKKASSESLIQVLALTNRLKAYRQLNSQDIYSTIEIDKKMETERLAGISNLLEAALLSLMKNGDLNRQQFDAILNQYKKAAKILDEKLLLEFNTALQQFSKKCAMRNRAALSNLKSRQHADKKNILKEVEMRENDKNALLTLVDTQCCLEQDDLSFMLKLKQDEGVERLRKEFSLKKRISIKELQQQTLKEFQAKPVMSEEKWAWLLNEHAKNVAALEKVHDDEFCRQRLVLEEKLARRRALVDLSDAQEKNQSEMLNSIAGSAVETIRAAKKQRVLTPDEAKVMTEKVMQQLITLKEAMDKEMAKQQLALHAKFTDLKKRKMDGNNQINQTELAEFERQCREHQRDGMLDPISVANKRFQLLAKHEVEKAQLEIQTDQENFTELKAMRDQITQTFISQLEDKKVKLLDDLKKDGMTEAQIKSILKKHQQESETLKQKLQQQYQEQEKSLQARLERRKTDQEKRMQQEKQERELIREQEKAVVDQVINNQFTMSADERDRIIKEHEMNMLRMENSITLQKLKQSQLLEEKLAQRKAKRMENLQQKQLTEKKAANKKNVNEDLEDRQAAAVDLLKSQAEERLALLKEDDEEINLEEEMEKVKVEMLHQRAVELRQQEERLGGIMADFQLSKAKELAEIEEKHKAINSLTANLIEDLHERGIMSDIEAEQCLERHKNQQEKLTDKLNKEKDKQEQILKQKLAARLQAREKSLLDLYEKRLKEEIDQSGDKTSVKLKRAAMNHKRNLEIDQFRQKMESEIGQTLEELRREHSVKKVKLIQELEMRLVASLVQQGKLQRSELKDCLHMLLPLKTNAELEELIRMLVSNDPDDDVSEPEENLLNSSSASMLRERIIQSVSLMKKQALPAVKEEKEPDRPPSANGRLKSAKKKQVVPLEPISGAEAERQDRKKLPPLRPISDKKIQPRRNYDDDY